MTIIIGILLAIIFVLRVKYLIRFFFSQRFWLGNLAQVCFFISAFAIMDYTSSMLGDNSPRYTFLIVFLAISWIFFNFMFRTFRAPIVFLFGVLTLGLIAGGMVGGDGAGGDGFDGGDSFDGDFGNDGFDSSANSFDSNVFDEIAVTSFQMPMFDTSNLAFESGNSFSNFAFEPAISATAFNWGAFESFDSMSTSPIDIQLDINDNAIPDSIEFDKDLDGTLDHIDYDMDNDGTLDFLDVDMDNDGVHDSIDNDMDNDGILDSNDSRFNPQQV